MGEYTSNYNLYLPEIGETGWGSLVNQNFVVIDQNLPITANDGSKWFVNNATYTKSNNSWWKIDTTKPSSGIHLKIDGTVEILMHPAGSFAISWILTSINLSKIYSSTDIVDFVSNKLRFTTISDNYYGNLVLTPMTYGDATEQNFSQTNLSISTTFTNLGVLTFSERKIFTVGRIAISATGSSGSGSYYFGIYNSNYDLIGTTETRTSYTQRYYTITFNQNAVITTTNIYIKLIPNGLTPRGCNTESIISGSSNCANFTYYTAMFCFT